MPAPSTTGGNLMGYPASVDNGLIAPFTLEAPDVSVLSASISIAAGAAYLNAVILYSPVTVTQMRCDITNGSPTGNIDMGIYDATGANGLPGNLLGHTGAVAATTGMFTQNLTANLPLGPGRYWLAFLDTASDQPAMRQSVVAGIGTVVRTTVTNLSVLPPVLGSVANNTNKVGLVALLSGSWS
jgi:hypothetical protein